MLAQIYKEIPQIDISKLLSALNLDLSRLWVERDTGSCLDYSFDIDSNEFLRFAEIDLAEGTTRGLINALSNAKRAIDCQVDKVLGCFGLLSRRNFPQKMDLLRSMGIVAPRIVNKVVKARNYLEHEFKIPEQEQVEDAIDIANLFITSLDRALHFFPEHYDLGTIIDDVYNDRGDPLMDKAISINFDEQNPRYMLIGYIFQNSESKESKKQNVVGKSIVLPHDKGYVDLIKFSLEVEKDITDLRLSGANLLSTFT